MVYVYISKYGSDLDLGSEFGALKLGAVHYKILQSLKDWSDDCSQQRLFINIMSSFPAAMGGKGKALGEEF